MELAADLVEGRFLARLNRFAALVEVAGRETMVHVANSGRMRELLVEGHRVLLRPTPGDHRKTAFDLALVDLGFTLTSADARLPSALVQEAIEGGRLRPFRGYSQVRREVVFGESRLDLLLDGPQGRCFIETKSVTLVEGGAGLFPDAPTTRGVRHMHSLEQAVSQGCRAAAVFVVQREDARSFCPNEAADPDFGQAFRRALSLGVEAYAYRCRVTEREVAICGRLPVEL